MAYSYYDKPSNSGYAQRYANQAVLHYVIGNRFYGSGFAKNIAWSVVAGPIDTEAQDYLATFEGYDYLKTAVFTDPSSGDEIDFVHMMATIGAHCYFTFCLDGNMDADLNAYAGWAGDLITLAGDVQNEYKKTNKDIGEITREMLKGSMKSSFSNSDLLADIDAIFIADYMNDTPIYEALETYYIDSYKSRYSLFLDRQFGGSQSLLQDTANSYLAPSGMTNAFKVMFKASYSEEMYRGVASAFAEYIAGKAGR